jgi:hypothetical protein
MKSFIFISTILSIVAVSCVQNKITVTGIAENRKDAAYVVVEKDSISYGLVGLSHWPEDIVGKWIKVSGTLSVNENKPIGPDEPQRQQITGVFYTILNPEWKVVVPKQK